MHKYVPVYYSVQLLSHIQWKLSNNKHQNDTFSIKLQRKINEKNIILIHCLYAYSIISSEYRKLFATEKKTVTIIKIRCKQFVNRSPVQ